MGLINQLNATTEYYWFNTEPYDIVNKASALLWKLMGNAIANETTGEGPSWEIKDHEIVDGGLMVKVPLEYNNSNSGGYGAQTVIKQDKQDIIDAARFPWGGIYASNTLNLNDLTQNTGDEAVISLTKQYMKSIIKSARVQMAFDILTSCDTTTRYDNMGNSVTGVTPVGNTIYITGLGDLFNTTTSTAYGSITQDAMANWKANVLATAEAISFEVMQKIFRQPNMGETKGMKPDFCVTTPTLRDGYERSLHPQQRYTETKMVEAGWENVVHKGAPIVGDPYIVTGYLYALNSNFISLRAHKDYNFTKPVWVNKEILGQPDIISANTRWRGNLYCSNRKMHVLHTNLTEPV
jgi:hypothetical protein